MRIERIVEATAAPGRIAPILALALGLAVSTGCQSSDPEYDPVRPGFADPTPASEIPNISIEDRRLSNHLAIGDPVITRSPGRPLEVTVPVRLTTRGHRNIQYRFDFLDTSGRPIKSTLGWQYRELPPRTQMFLSAVALDEAVDWRLIVRPAQ